ncbi:MAG: hypothetical protein AAGN35_15365, partial [Bacteroidota bacterium]
LWELIKSLTKPELYKFKERAFEKERRFPKYVQLFDVIYKQDVYDEEQIRTEFKGDVILNHLPRFKNYLYNRILEFIRDANSGEESELHGILEKVRILFYKRLYHHLPIIISRGKRLAYRMENYEAVRKLIRFEIGVLREAYSPEKYSQDIDALLDEELRVWKREVNKAELLRIDARFQKSWHLTGTERKLFLIEFTSNPIVTDQQLALSKSARVIQLQIQWLNSFFIGEFSSLTEGADQIIRIFENAPALLEDRSMYDCLVKAILYSSTFRVRSNDLAGAQRQFAKLNTLANAKKKTPLMFSEQETIFRLYLSLKTFDEQVGENAIASYLDAESSNFSEPSSKSEINISHLSSVYYLYTGKPQLALPWINRNRNRKRNSVRPDLVMASRLLFVVCHWQMENIDVVEREIRSIRTSWGRYKLMNEYYDFFLKLFSNLSKQQVSEKEIIVNSLQKLKQNEEAPLWLAMSHYFHLKDWLNAKWREQTVFQMHLSVSKSIDDNDKDVSSS